MELRNDSCQRTGHKIRTPWQKVRQTAENILRITGDRYYGNVDDGNLFKAIQVEEQYFKNNLSSLSFYEILQAIKDRDLDSDEDYDRLMSECDHDFNNSMLFFVSYSDLEHIPNYLHSIVKCWMYEYNEHVYNSPVNYEHRFMERDEIILNMTDWAEGDKAKLKEYIDEFDAMLEWRKEFKKNYRKNWRKMNIKFKNKKDKKFIEGLKTMPTSINVEHAGYNDGSPFESIFFFTYAPVTQGKYGFHSSFTYEQDFISMELNVMENNGTAEPRVFHHFNGIDYLHSTSEKEFQNIKDYIDGLIAYSKYVWKW